MTLSRIWQVRDVIVARQSDERRERNDRAEAVTRTLVLHIRTAAGDRNAKKAAAGVKLFEDPVKSKTPRVKREMSTELAPSFAGRLGGGQPLAGLTPELVAAAYGG